MSWRMQTNMGFLGLALLAGCGSVEPLGAGAIEVAWEVTPRGCEEAGVATIETRISGPEGHTERYACDVGSVEIGGLIPGIYDLQLVGLDGAGHPIFESDQRTVTVDADGAEDVGTLRLSARPAEIQAGWVFSNGRVCGANDVDSIVIAVYDAFDYEIARRPFDCDAGKGTIKEILAGAYLVEATGFSGMVETHHGTMQIKAGRGDVVNAEIVLDPAN